MGKRKGRSKALAGKRARMSVNKSKTAVEDLAPEVCKKCDDMEHAIKL